jgi:hypothetical protein
LIPTENNKEIFKNNEITVLCNVAKQSDSVLSGNIYVSNNLIDKQLTNIKLNLLVPKYITPKVVSTPTSHLEPRQQLGIKKEFTMTSSDETKPIKIQIKYSYNINNESTEVKYLIKIFR